ncbi:30S ribosome-binding factor RbfA [Methylococcus geothermalis]|uniref:Ribosome-binding factor A n=1 Tax=Methylococcus geothermalis TaxID=2681310 RepID=A0A858Q9P1_9GAMM|nr:30S ribosome-binding factor RbfA [Methylococcus geothermalis]QJD30475.1 30S ribosome-binding factor RbfA [Methylococcus geothermalis]
MPREFSRSDRVSAQMQREIAEFLRTGIDAPELGMITVSDVEVSRDLAVAKVFVTFLGGRLETKAAVKRLGEFAPQLRQALGRRMRMRVLPEIRFVYDDSIERGLHMDQVLRSLDGDGET